VDRSSASESSNSKANGNPTRFLGTPQTQTPRCLLARPSRCLRGETVRAIQCLKLFNRESDREGQWLNRYAEVVNANVRLGHAKIAFSTINDLIFGVELILIVFLAARLVLAGQLTVGMVFAFMAYLQEAARPRWSS